MSAKSRKRKTKMKAERGVDKKPKEANRNGSTLTLFFEDEYANALKYDGGDKVLADMLPAIN